MADKCILNVTFHGVTQQTHQFWHYANYKGHESDLLLLITTMALSALNRL